MIGFRAWRDRGEGIKFTFFEFILRYQYLYLISQYMQQLFPFQQSPYNIFIDPIHYPKMHKHNKTSKSNFDLNKIIQVDDPQVQDNVKSKVKQRLLEQAQFLLQKKRKQQQQKQRIKKLQQSLEIRRERKLKTIAEKQNKSQILMQKNKQTQQKKIKQHQDYFNQVLNNYQKKSKEQIQNAITKQKQFQSSKSKSRVTLRKNWTNSKIQKVFSANRYLDTTKYFRLSQQLEIKSKKAQNNHEKFNKSIIDRLRQKSESISHAQEKALNRTMLDETQNLKSWGRKVQTIETMHEIKRTQRQRKMLQKKESFKYKFDKCSQNLKTLEYKQQQKAEKLHNKLIDRKYSPKEWRNANLEKYWNLWSQNSKMIQQKLNNDANKILQKHQIISQQNRVYKQKKQKLLQMMKKI